MIEQNFEEPRVWKIAKPMLTDFYVPFSIYDPSFHKRKITTRPAPRDPCCTSCRQPESEVTICVYVPDESYKPALDYVIANAASIERSLIAKLGSIQQRMLVDHVEENLPGMPDWEKHWAFILKELGGQPEELLNRMYKLTALSVVRSDPGGEWMVGYEFQTAWDMDHGLEIVMWDDKVLGFGGMFELTTTSGSLIEKCKYVQEDVLDPIDFRLA